MEPIEFIETNKDRIIKNSQENWITLDPNDLINHFKWIINHLSSYKSDRERTIKILKEWLEHPDRDKIPFYSMWLMSATENDFTFVYATNYLINHYNNTDGGLIMKPKETTFWELYQELNKVYDTFLIKEKIKQEIPDLVQRRKFLMIYYDSIKASKSHMDSFQKENAEYKQDKVAKIGLIESMLKETSSILDEIEIARSTLKNKPFANGKPSIQYINFQDIFREPDQKEKAVMVKKILREMSLLENNDFTGHFTNKYTEQSKVRYNVLAYVFAALRDIDNNLSAIRPGADDPPT
jgi:hypothetical protein